MNWSEIRASWIYRFALIIVFAFASGLLFYFAGQRFLDPRVLYFDDFVEYWAAGRLNIGQGNPYNPEQIKIMQMQVGRLEGVPLMMWNPPWTLSLVMPFGLMRYTVGRLLWLLISLAIIVFVADYTWRFSGGDHSQRWLVWLFACTFGPSLQVLRLGQITPFLLVGVAGFMYLMENKRWFWAGSMAALWLIKPHLLYLVMVVLLLWILEHRNFIPLMGMAATLGAALVIPWLVNPAVFQQYLVATTQYPPAEWMTPTLGGLLRYWLGPDHFWLQFAPMVFGGLWGIGYWLRNRTSWQWCQHLPLLILVSLATSAYGWNFDQVISLVALIPLAQVLLHGSLSWRKWGLVGSYIVVNGLLLFSNFQQLWYWWVAPCFLGWWIATNYAFPRWKVILTLRSEK